MEKELIGLDRVGKPIFYRDIVYVFKKNKPPKKCFASRKSGQTDAMFFSLCGASVFSIIAMPCECVLVEHEPASVEFEDLL